MSLIKHSKKALLMLILCLCVVRVNSFFNNLSHSADHSIVSGANSEHSFPFVGLRSTYAVTQTTDKITTASGTLEVIYDSMVNATVIHGFFHVMVSSIVQYYDELADGSESLTNRDLEIDASETYIIYTFMVYFFDWSDPVTPTPMWIFPEDMAINATVNFWNYTSICKKSDTIPLMGRYFEVFVFQYKGTSLEMTLMYGDANNGLSDEFSGLLFYLSAAFRDPTTGLLLEVNFRLKQTTANLIPLRELNRNSFLIVTISFYSVVFVGTFIYRLKSRRDLIGGEV
jgi:hypothetical protein